MMAINYNVLADVIDIGQDRPKDTDTFLVDSNVWYWTAYPRCSQSDNPPKSYQVSRYPAFVDAALAAGARLLRFGLSFAELSHLIEKTEYEINKRANVGITTKEFRHNLPTERDSVTGEVEAAWASVRSLAIPMTATIDEPATDAAMARFKSQMVDGYDLFILEAMQTNGVAKIITDDGDFATVPGIQVFTANRSVIQAARTQGRLIKR